MNNRDGLPRPGYHYNYEGYTIGGPAYIPGRFNRNKDQLFFFWSEEYQQQLIPEGVRRVTVPTALERKGDFSASVDQNNSPVAIKDYLNGGQAFSGNVIPQNRFTLRGSRRSTFTRCRTSAVRGVTTSSRRFRAPSRGTSNSCAWIITPLPAGAFTAR